MRPFFHLLMRLFWSSAAACIGFCIGFFVWLYLYLAFGYPGDTASGSRIPSEIRVLRMNEWQWFLEKDGSSLIPIVFAGLFGYLTLQSKHWNQRKIAKISDPEGTVYYE